VVAPRKIASGRAEINCATAFVVSVVLRAYEADPTRLTRRSIRALTLRTVSCGFCASSRTTSFRRSPRTPPAALTAST